MVVVVGRVVVVDGVVGALVSPVPLVPLGRPNPRPVATLTSVMTVIFVGAGCTTMTPVGWNEDHGVPVYVGVP